MINETSGNHDLSVLLYIITTKSFISASLKNWLQLFSITGCTKSSECQKYGLGFCNFENVSNGNCQICSKLRNLHNPNGSCENAKLGLLGYQACKYTCEGKTNYI